MLKEKMARERDMLKEKMARQTNIQKKILKAEK